MSDTAGSDSRGIFGIRVNGVPTDRMTAVPRDWPLWLLEHVVDPDARVAGATHLDDDAALIEMGDGSRLELKKDGSGGRAILTSPSPLDPRELAHPHLAPLASVTACWRGWIAIHAGGFVVDGRAWIIPAIKGSGKTTVIAQAAHLGLNVLSDDITVIDLDLNVYAGPRFVDLRRDVSEALGWGVAVGHLGLRERWRMAVADCAPSYPLGGFVFPTFGETSVTRLGAGAALSTLIDSLLLRIPGPRANVAFEAATRTPSYRWVRPADLTVLKQNTERLIETLRA